MGTLTAKKILDGAWIKAADEQHERWPEAEGLRWLNDGQRAIVIALRSAYTANVLRPLQAGKTRQTLAGLGLVGGLSIIGVHGFAKNGNLYRAVTTRDKRLFDERDPYWRTRVGNAVEEAMLDPDEPTAFYVHPAVLDGEIELTYSLLPPEVPNINAPIALGDEWGGALEAFALASFYAKDATQSQGPTKHATYMAEFAQWLGAVKGAELAAGAGANTKGGAA